MHFAGEHTSPWPGWMQGALESAKRVTKEIEDSDHAVTASRTLALPKPALPGRH
jgi:hypothetical protein